MSVCSTLRAAGSGDNQLVKLSIINEQMTVAFASAHLKKEKKGKAATLACDVFLGHESE